MEKQIDLNNFIHSSETALVGRENGENVLKKLQKKNLDFKELESTYEAIEIDIPQRIVSINKSFFLGLFETVIERTGEAGFFEKYKFNTTDHIHNKIKSHVKSALLNASQEDILNA